MIIVPNGGAPEKIEYFSRRSDVKLFDNGGDNRNAKLFNNLDKYASDLDKILITSEEQLEYLSTINSKDILDRCIYLKSELNNKPDYLCNKLVILDLPNLGKGSISVNKSKLHKYINDKNYVIKETNSSGSRGVHFTESIGNIKKNDKFTSEIYLVQPVCKLEYYYNFTIPVIIRDHKLRHFIPILGDEGTYCMSKWRSLHIDGTKNKYLISGIEEIIDTFKLIDGFAEFEIFVNRENPWDMKLVDVNPRWSYDNSTCTEFVRLSGLDKSYDHLDGYLNNTKFYVPDNFVGPVLRLGERYSICQNFYHI